jgi:hypothetical protein
MSQAFTRILDNQSNKLLANLPSMDINVPGPISLVQHVPLQMPSPQINLDEGIQECRIIKFFGFEFTIYSLILVIVLIACVGYFLYKYFFTKTDLVVYKKMNNLKKESKKIKEKIKKEDFSKESENSNMSGSSNASSLAQTLDM